jgi:hypothetical protein
MSALGQKRTSASFRARSNRRQLGYISCIRAFQ